MANRTVKNIFEYALFLTFIGLARTLPRRLSLTLGGFIGWAFQFLFPDKRRIAFDNIRQAFPEMTRTQVREAVTGTFRHLGISGMEMLTLDRFKSEQDLENFFEFNGLDNLRKAYEQDRGVILLTGHLGFWEIGTFFLPKLGFPADWVAKKMKNPLVDRYFRRMREAGGGKVLESKHGARRILKSLKKKRGVAVLLDQHTSRSTGVKVDFFGRPAYTTPVISHIAMKHQVPVVPIFAYRTPDFRYRIVIEPMILLEDGDDESVIRNTALLTGKIEEAIRRDITQWFWVHRRWRPEKS